MLFSYRKHTDDSDRKKIIIKQYIVAKPKIHHHFYVICDNQVSASIAFDGGHSDYCKGPRHHWEVKQQIHHGFVPMLHAATHWSW